jgi:anti-sigma factor RsiW
MKKAQSHNHERCRELFDRMSEYLDKELDEPSIQGFEAHLRLCQSCRNCLATLERTIALCGRLPNPSLSRSFSLHLREILHR